MGQFSHSQDDKRMIVRDDFVLRVSVLIGVLAVAGIGGCGGSSAQKRVDDLLKESGQSRGEVYPLAGRITIDGETPQAGGFGQPHLVVLLFDQSKLDGSAKPVRKAVCDPKGEFVFSTYDEGDGVPPGKYVLAFVELRFERRKGYLGKDGLKNLYNDPEANSKVEDFVIDHHAGKKDYVFNLQLAGREQASPGPKAVTKIKA
jgi:hypothetical protein